MVRREKQETMQLEVLHSNGVPTGSEKEVAYGPRVDYPRMEDIPQRQWSHFRY